MSWQRKLCVFLALGVALLGASRAFAWGHNGHRITAKIAETHLTPEAQAAIKALLEPGEDLAKASTYADEHKREIRGSAPWHFVNVPITAAAYADQYCDAKKGCILSKLPEFQKTLADKSASKDDRRMALRFVVHLVGDLHQPLHVADHGDEGGNGIQLRFFRRHMNLHAVWDEGFIQQAHLGTSTQKNIDEDAWVEDLSKVIGRRADAWMHRVDLVAWANESLLIAKHAYINPTTGALLQSGDEVGQEYYDRNLPRVKVRLAQGGVRLAKVLNDAFAQ